jgi:hypothetical protein
MIHARGIVAGIAPPPAELPLKMVDLYRFDKATDESGRSIGSQTSRRPFATPGAGATSHPAARWDLERARETGAKFCVPERPVVSPGGPQGPST